MGAVAVGTACWVPMADRPPWWPRPTSSGTARASGRVLRWHRDRRGRRAPVAHGHEGFAEVIPGRAGSQEPHQEPADFRRRADDAGDCRHPAHGDARGSSQSLGQAHQTARSAGARPTPPPYVLGAWLGDGTSQAAQITTADAEMVMRLEAGASWSRRLPRHTPLTLRVEAVSGRQCVVCGAVHAAHKSGEDVRGSCGGKAKGTERLEPTLR